jgi:hypothetical protein
MGGELDRFLPQAAQTVERIWSAQVIYEESGAAEAEVRSEQLVLFR